METKYLHLQVNKDDRVRIKAKGIIAEGRVHSSYSSFVYTDNPDNTLITPVTLLGYSPAGIEMYDDRSGGSYRYWKAEDGGTVEKLIGDEYIQVYPIQFEGFVRS